VGEIGLEKGSPREEDIFCAHLELAPEVANRGKVFGIHTPRRDKARVTERVIKALGPYAGYCDRMVVDHCTPDTAGLVLSKGFWAGITVSPIKCSSGDVEHILKSHAHAVHRIMLNTDSGFSFYEDLYDLYLSGGLDRETKALVCRENALCFFGLRSGPGPEADETP
jgi:predicted metal-dependent TIM-barrel fold hydrolase